MDLENEAHPDCFCPECEGDPEAELGAALEMSEDETPTTSDEDFIVSDFWKKFPRKMQKKMKWNSFKNLLQISKKRSSC